MSSDGNARALGIVRRLLAERLAGRDDEPSIRKTQIDSLDLDSLTKLELILELEDAFAISLSEAKIAACRTIGDLLSLVEKATAGR